MTTPNFADHTIWTGDNLDILRSLNSASVDLIYLAPPFNSNRISSSSNEGDMVLAPFCGCATACVAAENLGRRTGQYALAADRG